MMVNKAKAREPLTQKILDLTLEIIFLLTGEDHMVVKIHEMVTDNSRHQISNRHRRTQSFNTEPPPQSGINEQNNEKILELTNKIIQLLTGEVPIRCEDVAVYLSMEEWEYVEGHKDFYEVMLEKHQPIIAFDNSVSGELHTPVSFSYCGTENKTKSEVKYLNKTTTKRRVESATYTDQESPTTQWTEYSPTATKEELDSCGEVNLTVGVIDKPSENTQTGSSSIYTRTESDSHGEGDILHPNMYPLTEDTQSEDPSTDIKESPTYEKGNFTDINKPTEHTQTEWSHDNSGEYLKGNTNLLKINDSESLIESRKSDQSIYSTDLINHESVSKDHAAVSFEMGKVSCSESAHDVIYREEPFFSTAYGENSTSTSALTHQQLHIEGDTFSCPECGKCFIDSIALKTHQRIHTQEKKFKCNECGKCFAQAANLATHAIIHTGEKPFKCPDCGKCFAQSSTLVAHKMIHTGVKTFNCPECEKCFTQSSSFSRHKKIHTGDKPFKCTECGNCFAQASSFAAHKRTHTGEKPFKCTECGNCFSRGSSLARHKMVHTGEKPFKCPECGKSFIEDSDLTKHKRSHTGEKPFKCSECGKCFIQASYLTAHKMIHTGEKTFKCPECEKCFTVASDFKKHKRLHTGEKPFKCSECGKCFALSSYLINHKKIHPRQKSFQYF
uniref:C2H2-type domain-containing protein n=1 Tax=Leptobrachium leishanense TaxID=445787 RepID=A0A8C5N3X8_9ANUR